MKPIVSALAIISLTLCNFSCWAQSNPSANWLTFSGPSNRFTFKMPNSGLVVDTLNLWTRAADIDSLISMQVIACDSVISSAATPDSLFTLALNQANGDTLIAFAQMAVISTGGLLVELVDTVLIGGKRVVDLGIEIPGGPPQNASLFFQRTFVIGRRFVSMSIFGYSSDLQRLVAYKQDFYSSLQL